MRYIIEKLTIFNKMKQYAVLINIYARTIVNQDYNIKSTHN